jgi:Domain of unknown function (DUF6457)
MSPHEETDLDAWLHRVCAELELPEAVDRTAVLDLARDVAHGVTRPAAPLTAYLVGVAVGRGADPAAAIDAVRRRVGETE